MAETNRAIGIVTHAVVLTGLLLGVAVLHAHEEFKIEGSIVTFRDRSLVVKRRTGESFTIQLQKSTVVRLDGEPVPQAELRAGRDVTVRIMADTLYDKNPFVLSATLRPNIE